MTKYGMWLFWSLDEVLRLDGAVQAFAPTFVVELVVIGLLILRRIQQRRISALVPRTRLPASALWILPLQVWTLQASLHAMEFHFPSYIGLTDPTRPVDGLFVLARSLVALGLLSACQTAGVAVLGRGGFALGLSRRGRTAFLYGLGALVLDAFFYQFCAKFWTTM